MVLGDRDQLVQVAQNLIDNALKYSPANARVIVEVTAYLMRADGRGRTALTAPATIAGLAAGVAVMYLTALLVEV